MFSGSLPLQLNNVNSPGTVMRHIIQMTAAQLSSVYTAGYQQLCLLTVIFNSETQLSSVMLIHYRNPVECSPAGTNVCSGLSAPSPCCFFNECLRFFWNWSRTRASSLNVTPLARANLFLLNIRSAFTPLLFPKGGLESLNAIILWFCLNLAACEQEKEPNVLPEWSGGKLCNKQGVGG